MTTDSRSNNQRPEGISIPADVEVFIQKISDYYRHQDINQILNCVSNSFLHQGLNKKDFETCLRQSYILKYLTRLRITILTFKEEQNIAEINGFAESNLGVIPASDPSFPLIEGTRLIMEGSEWKFLGNQRKSSLGLYNVFHQLSAYFVPSESLLYSSLLPKPFGMPSEPTVFVKITDFERVRLPLPPYLVAHVQILAEYKGLLGWYTLTMPETEWIPVEMGKTLGYPKYVADSISFVRTNEGWSAEVVNKGEIDLSLSLQYEVDQSQANWFEKMTCNYPLSIIRKLMPPFKEKPWFLIMPIKGNDTQNTELILKGDPPISGIPKVKENFGNVRISLKTNQQWGGLFPREVNTKGIFMNFVGELILRHTLCE
jgi:hypothetical protein